MSNAVEQAQKYIENEEYKQALKLARKRHGKDDIDEYLTILDMLNDAGYILALEEKGLYYQYYDEIHVTEYYIESYLKDVLSILTSNVVNDIKRVFLNYCINFINSNGGYENIGNVS